MRNFFGAALCADGSGCGAAVLHGDGLDVLRRGADLTFHAVNLNGFGRSGHGRRLLGREWRRQLYPTVMASRPSRSQPFKRILVTLALTPANAERMEWSHRCGRRGRNYRLPAVDGRLMRTKSRINTASNEKVEGFRPRHGGTYRSLLGVVS